MHEEEDLTILAWEQNFIQDAVVGLILTDRPLHGVRNVEKVLAF